MRSLSGALRYRHHEGAASYHPAGGGRRGGGPGPDPRGREQDRARRQASACHDPGPGPGCGLPGGRPGYPAGVRPHQGRTGPAAGGCRFRGLRPGPAPGQPSPGRSSPRRHGAARPRCRRALPPGTGTEPDDRVLAARPARRYGRCARVRVGWTPGTPGNSLAAGDLEHVRAGIPRDSWTSRTSRSTTGAALPAGDVPRGTRPDAARPGQLAAPAIGAARRADASAPRHPARPTPVAGRPSATARNRPGRASGSVRPGLPTSSGTAAARARKQHGMAATRPRLPPSGQPRLPRGRRKPPSGCRKPRPGCL